MNNNLRAGANSAAQLIKSKGGMMMLIITETKFGSSFSSELLPKGYVVEFRRDRNLKGGGVMIVGRQRL